MDINNLLNSPAFVIHLEEFVPERTNFFKTNIKNAGYNDIRVFKGVKVNNGDVIKEFENLEFRHDTSNGRKGCLISHLKLYKHIISNNIEICTIFEDDVHFHPKWKELAPKYYSNTPNNFDIIFMGNEIENCDNTIPKINTLSCLCTHAYVITLEGAKKLLAYLLYWSKLKVDDLKGFTAIDLMIKDIQKKMNKKKIKKNIIWYCWNATCFPCEFNQLPLQGISVRNCGLVFQSDQFVSMIE
jgi:GR25 family glycosyltransferase involved in LPS biosynthesis